MSQLSELGLPKWLSNDELRRICGSCLRLKSLEFRFGEKVDDVSPIGDLEKLESLWLEPHEWWNARRQRHPVRGVPALGRLRNLRQARLHVSESITSIDFTSEWGQLRELDLCVRGTSVDISPVGKLRELVWLDLDSEVEDIGSLAGLSKLVALSLSWGSRQLRDLSALESLPNLMYVDVKHCSIERLWAVPEGAKLESLNAGHTEIADLGPLAAAAALRQLDLDNCEKLEKIAGLGALPNLVRLSMANCGRLTDHAALAQCRGLTALNLARSVWLRDLECVSRLTDLDELRLEETPVEDLTPLVALENLRTLDLAECPNIVDIRPLGKLANLESLALNGCKGIEDFRPLGRLKRLSEIRLEGTNVTDLSFVKDLRDLRVIDITYCDELNDISPLEEAVKRGCHVVVVAGTPFAEQLHSLEAKYRRPDWDGRLKD